MVSRPQPVRSVYPWREGNLVSLLVDGDAFLPRMLECIASARRYLLLEMYLVESGAVLDRFISALGEAVSRRVRVCLLLDDFGIREMRSGDRLRLVDAGVELVLYNPLRYRKWRVNLYRDHRKLLLVDGEVAFTGGMGITDRFSPRDCPQGWWHEVMVEYRGPVVRDWQHSFTVIWNRYSDTPLRLSGPSSVPAAGGVAARLAVIQPPRQEAKGSLTNRIRAARHRVWIATPYFIPTRKIRRLLKQAARRGVDVRILVPGEETDHPAVRRVGQRYYQRLLRNGVRIFEYQPRFIHAKIWLCDRWASIGSTNLDRWSLHWNLEANLEVEEAAFAERVVRLLEEDFAHSCEITYREWKERPWYQRLREWFWSTAAMWTQYYSQRRPR
ncbi:MAG TPA: phosphatidylserine/phosphatidylglycerophosphate/cardiolipin synthase family protein [Gammaproteobacteria bacterium]|nr:phosphatidylserine/phosphatidylglycerophosphate/cardiolipin synthase family protein [Gammaproteobacteria bacterium]